MIEQFIRTAMLIGENGQESLFHKHVAVFGVGGVGGYAAEALARAGIGKLTLIDNDTVSESNLNRQIIALHSTIGKEKVEVMKERILDINPMAQVICRKMFYLPENAGEIDFTEFDYIVDAVDTVTAKIDIISRAVNEKIPIVSSMGAGNKLDSQKFQIADLSKTSVCPLAKVMRRELKKRGIEHIKVVYSTENKETVQTKHEQVKVSAADHITSEDVSAQSQTMNSTQFETKHKQENEPETLPIRKAKHIPGSIVFAPAIAGLMLAGEVINDLIKEG